MKSAPIQKDKHFEASIGAETLFKNLAGEPSLGMLSEGWLHISWSFYHFPSPICLGRWFRLRLRQGARWGNHGRRTLCPAGPGARRRIWFAASDLCRKETVGVCFLTEGVYFAYTFTTC